MYSPKYSLIDLQIFICSKCGFVQSLRDKSIKPIKKQNYEQIESLSCDADYSSVRVGKQQMTKFDIECIQGYQEIDYLGMSILDMASARGHFARWAHDVSKKVVTCIEPDVYMSKDYAQSEFFEILNVDYRSINFEKQFDFIYSCHTLEHYRDPKEYLNFVFDNLRFEGYFFVNVPNLLGVLDSVILDDFFYDKHRSYFDPETLNVLLSSMGFKILKSWTSASCIRILAQKSPAKTVALVEDGPGFVFHQNFETLKKYVEIIEKSRKLLPNSVSSINANLVSGELSVILGCGRMLDAFIKYGGLDLNSFDFLVDNFLGLATQSIYQHKLFTWESLPELPGTPNFLVLSRTSTNELINLIMSKYPMAKITSSVELLG